MLVRQNAELVEKYVVLDLYVMISSKEYENQITDLIHVVPEKYLQVRKWTDFDQLILLA